MKTNLYMLICPMNKGKCEIAHIKAKVNTSFYKKSIGIKKIL